MDHQQQLKIKSYTPDASTYAPRIRNEQWEQFKPLLRYLHDESRKRAEMLDVLRKQGFNPSIGQLNAKMSAWGFKVYSMQPGESSDRESETPTQMTAFDTTDAEMSDITTTEPTASPSSRKSIPSVSMSEPPRDFHIQITEPSFTLDDLIATQCLSQNIVYYWTSVKPTDFGIRPPNMAGGLDRAFVHSVVSVADFLCAVHCFEKAFDLYYHVLEHLVTVHPNREASLTTCLVQCARAATTDLQCDFVLYLTQQAHAYCTQNMLGELASCFTCLAHDLQNRVAMSSDSFTSPHNHHINDLPLLVAMNQMEKPSTLRRAWIEQQLLDCDSTCSTLAHLSVWCQDTLSYYRLENQAIVQFSTKTETSMVDKMTAFENDFQSLVRALVIDFLNSPGPSLKKANTECKDDSCLFRTTMSPCTSLIVMAHLLYEPLRLQTQATTNEYLLSRAQNLAGMQWTTALQELKSFAATDDITRCGAFVDTYMRHFSTTLVYRRFVSKVSCDWDRLEAGKRLARMLQSNPAGVHPHAGLPSARRSVLKAMVAPFPHDPSLTEGRPSTVSDSGSMVEFRQLSSHIQAGNTTTVSRTPSDSGSVATHGSWNFYNVTGLPNQLSARNSLSSRTGELNEIEEEYRGDLEGIQEEFSDSNQRHTYDQRHLSTSNAELLQRKRSPVRRKPRA